MSFSASRRSSFVGGTPSMVAPGSEGVSCRASVRDRHPLGSWTDMSTDPEIGPRRFAVVGDGRLGNALAPDLRPGSRGRNYLSPLEDAPHQAAATAGAPRDVLVPWVGARVENRAAAGGGGPTAPIARGDEETVARQGAAVAEGAPRLL